MDGRETVGETGKISTIALMAPPYNKNNDDSPTRVRAKKLVVIIKKALDNFIEGHIARYKADYMPRAFGDAFQDWGVSTVLIESGIPKSREKHHLTRLNYIALLAAFDAISGGIINDVDPEEYEQIPLQGIQLFDIVIENALIYSGRDYKPFKGDIGINISKKRKKNKSVFTGTIEEIGDLSYTSGRTVIASDNLVVTPGLILRSEESLEKSLKIGITTPIQTSAPGAIKLSTFPEDGCIKANKISLYTAIPATFLNMDQKGIIDIDMIADMLVFDSEDHDLLSIKNLKYVLKNGEVVYTK
jgi:hypothetical protein